MTILDLLVVWACLLGIYLFASQHIGRPIALAVTSAVEQFSNPLEHLLSAPTTAPTPVLDVADSALTYPALALVGEPITVKFTVKNVGKAVADTTSLAVDTSLFDYFTVTGTTPTALRDHTDQDGKRHFDWKAPIPGQSSTYALQLSAARPGAPIVWVGVYYNTVHMLKSWGDVKIEVH